MLCASRVIGAQQSAAADSAAAARNAWRTAADALQRGDSRAARAEVDRAARAWPSQPAYLWAQAMLAVRDSDATVATRALDAYANLGLGRDLRADAKIGPLLGSKFESIAARHEANRAPVANSGARPLLSDSTFWPEGIDADPRTRRLYVASVRHHTVAEVSPDGRVRELLERDRDDVASVMGVRVDTARKSLWITTSGLRNVPGFRAKDSSAAALLRIDLATGAIVQRFDVAPAPGGHVLGDLALAGDGTVYVTDSTQPIVYRLRPGATVLEEIRSPLFYSLQGVAPTPDGKWLYLADYSLGLLRMNVASGVVVALAPPTRGTTIGCDGIVWFNGAIIAVQNGVTPARVVRIVPDEKRDRVLRVEVLDQNLAVADEPTIGTLLGDDFLYIANSQWDKFTDDGARVPSHALTAPVALRLRLPR